jgi:hypothetical protein
MADNVTLNTMSGGAVVATDDTGTAHVQIIKLAISADGSATVIPADATYGLDVDVTRLPALPTGANTIGAVTQASGPWTVIERGTVIASTSASVTTTSGQIVASSATRRTIVLTNLGSDYVWIGASGVTDNQGIRLAPGQALTIDRSPTAAVHAKAASGTQTVAIFTESD